MLLAYMYLIKCTRFQKELAQLAEASTLLVDMNTYILETKRYDSDELYPETHCAYTFKENAQTLIVTMSFVFTIPIWRK